MLTLRNLQPTDIPAVLAIQAQAYPGILLESADFFLNRLALAPDHCWIALRGEFAAGYLISYPWVYGAAPELDVPLEQIPASADTWFLHDCAVASDARGLGVARALWSTAGAHARQGGLAKAALVALADAVGYWEQFGYAPARGDVAERLREKLAGYGAGACYMGRG